MYGNTFQQPFGNINYSTYSNIPELEPANQSSWSNYSRQNFRQLSQYGQTPRARSNVKFEQISESGSDIENTNQQDAINRAVKRPRTERSTAQRVLNFSEQTPPNRSSTVIDDEKPFVPSGQVSVPETSAFRVPAREAPVSVGSVPKVSAREAPVPAGSVPRGSVRKAPTGSVPRGSARKAPTGSVPTGSVRKAPAPSGSVPTGSVSKAPAPTGSVPIGESPKGPTQTQLENKYNSNDTTTDTGQNINSNNSKPPPPSRPPTENAVQNLDTMRQRQAAEYDIKKNKVLSAFKNRNKSPTQTQLENKYNSNDTTTDTGQNINSNNSKPPPPSRPPTENAVQNLDTMRQRQAAEYDIKKNKVLSAFKNRNKSPPNANVAQTNDNPVSPQSPTNNVEKFFTPKNLTPTDIRSDMYISTQSHMS
jgi:hypothetical protein